MPRRLRHRAGAFLIETPRDATEESHHGTINGFGLRRLPLEQPRSAFARSLRTRLIREANAATVDASSTAESATDNVHASNVIPLPLRATPQQARAGRMGPVLNVGTWGRRRLGAAAASLVVVAGSLGFLTAQALPEDSPEPATFGAAERPGPATRMPTADPGAAHLKRAQRDLRNATAQTNGAVVIGHALESFSRHARLGAHRVLTRPDTHDERAGEPLAAFLRDATLTLSRIAGTVPGPAEDSYITATDTVHVLSTRAQQRFDAQLFDVARLPVAPGGITTRPNQHDVSTPPDGEHDSGSTFTLDRDRRSSSATDDAPATHENAQSSPQTPGDQLRGAPATAPHPGHEFPLRRGARQPNPEPPHTARGREKAQPATSHRTPLDRGGSGQQTSR